MQNPINFSRYRDYVAACEKENITPMSRTEWNYKCMKDTFED